MHNMLKSQKHQTSEDHYTKGMQYKAQKVQTLQNSPKTA